MLRAVTVERLPIATRLWRAQAADGHLISLVDPAAFEVDQYRTVRHMIERLPAPMRLIAVTSAAAGDGKTTTAINLAAVLAHAPDARVLVVDLDLRTPAVARRLGLGGPAPGLADLLLDPGLPPEAGIWDHPGAPLSVLPAGRTVPVPSDLLRSPRLRTLIGQLRQRYAYVVVDTPPVALVPDARLIADQIDGFVMVVAAHRTPRALLEDALNAMDPAKVIGIVFNGADRLLSGYYGHYYRRRGGARRGRPAR